MNGLSELLMSPFFTLGKIMGYVKERARSYRRLYQLPATVTVAR